MLYLFSGDDAGKKLAQYEKFMDKLPAQAEVFLVSRNNFAESDLENLAGSASLFAQKNVAVFQNIMDRADTAEIILNKLKILGESENIFVFLEGKLLKPVLDLFKKAGAEVNIFEVPKLATKKFDNFLLASAFGGKDKLNTWVYFRQAIEAGASLEELSGILFWKVKDMLLRHSFGKWTEKELQETAGKLAYLLPEARKEGEDAEAAFEEFLLEAFN